jgi:hypothetical protein
VLCIDETVIEDRRRISSENAGLNGFRDWYDYSEGDEDSNHEKSM